VAKDVLHFEWDGDKARRNLAEHGISFEEAREVFYDDLARVTEDPDHSIGEGRLLIFGTTKVERLVLVSFVDRGSSIRIISARKATNHERKRYEEDIL
jgi:uncharacterized DUF497 family protein